MVNNTGIDNELQFIRKQLENLYTQHARQNEDKYGPTVEFAEEFYQSWCLVFDAVDGVARLLKSRSGPEMMDLVNPVKKMARGNDNG